MGDAAEARANSKTETERISVELSSRRTGLSFQRTRMSADRTLMSVIRTSLSLIGFGFTIFQVFQKLYEAHVVTRPQAPRNFGQALVTLGLLALALGIAYHLGFMLELRRMRGQLKAEGLIYAKSAFPVSQTLIIALLLLMLGLFALVSMFFGIGPFGG